MSNSKGFVWWVERADIGISKTTDYGITFTSPQEVLEVRVFCSKLANHFKTGAAIDLTEESDLPQMFHDALISKVNAMVYEQNPESIQVAGYWEGKYRESIHEAKKYGNENRVVGSYIKGEDY